MDPYCEAERPLHAIRLVKSTADLVVDGEPRPGVTLFVSEDCGTDALLNMWIIRTAITETLRAKACQTYAQGVKLFCESQSRAGVSLVNTTVSDVVRFKAELTRMRQTTPWADADTVAVYVYAVSHFFGFCAENGLIPARPFRIKRRRGYDDGVAIPSVAVPRPTGKAAVVFNRRQLRAIMANVGLKGEDAREAVQLMILWGWGTGLRKFEITALCRRKLIDAVRTAYLNAGETLKADISLRGMFVAATTEAFIVELWPDDTKGGVGGTFLVPRDLIKRTVEYVDAHPSTSPPGNGPDPVFLGRLGRPFKADTLGRYYHAAVHAAGLKGRFHDLRHTYATRTVAAFKAAGHAQLGVLFVQAQLRHQSLSTTAKYLHCVEMAELETTVHLVVNRHFRSEAWQ